MRHLFTASVGALAIAACSTALYAQETTSTIRGSVTANGAPVSGATVTITHVPTGSTKTTVSGSGGEFSAAGLRPGGPFTVKVVASGYADSSVTDIQLTAGQPLALPVMLESTGNEIVVTATSTRATELSPGPITALTRNDIEGVSSTRRDIRDLVRRDPFATLDVRSGSRGVMIAGQNARLNKFSIEGLAFSDDFGLNDGGLPTERGPVPLDSIEQLSVKIAPYDIQEGNFQGGAINVILRSGSNKITGSAFYTFNSDGLTGNKSVGGPSNPSGKVALDFKSKTYGGFISGPLIKDKLFLAFSYEHLAEGTPITIGTAGFSAVVPNLSDAQIANISTIAKSVYNYDTLGVQSSTLEKDEKWTLKGDWNISETQRFTATWIHDDSSNASTAGFSSTSPISPALGLQSNNYTRPEKVDSYVGQLISDWADNVHTEVRGNFRKYDLTPVPFGEFNFAQMQVCLDPTATPAPGVTGSNATLCSQGSNAVPGGARIYFGPDQFRHFNYVRYKQYGGDAALKVELGDFSLKGTAAYTKLKVQNAFTQNAFGNYYFDSVADFQNKRASTLALNGSVTGNLLDTLASFQYSQATVGGQIAYDPDPTMNITVGMRADLWGGIQPPALNQFFTNRYGFSNRSVINGKMVLQPRLSATYSGIDHLKLKAGFGLFAGGSPNVFLGNSYSVSGVFANSINIQRNVDGTPGCQAGISAALCSAALDNVNGRTINPLVLDFLRTNVGSLQNAAVNAMDPNYHMQSTWKASFSADYNADFDNFLGSNWNFGGDLYYGFVNYAPIYKDLRLRQVGTAPDGRARYVSLVSQVNAAGRLEAGNANSDLLLTNTKKGYSFVAVARFDKGFDFGLNVGVSYTFQDVKDVSPANGTTASGTYGQSAVVDPNIAAYGTSIYQVRNSFKGHIDFENEFIENAKTRFSLFAERRSGLPYSLTMTDSGLTNSHGNVFGVTSNTNRYLLYVPNGLNDPLVANTTAADAATLTALDGFITANGLGKYRGKILPKNSQTSPHFTKIDLHIEQEVPVPLVATGKIKLFADIDNVLNLIDSKYGSLRQVFFPNLASVVTVSCAAFAGNNCTQYRYAGFTNPTIDNVGRISLYAIRVGAKIEF